MRTVAYALKGKEIPPHLVGTVINIRVAESDADIGEGKVFASADAMREKANDGVVIAVQGLLRNKAANTKTPATAESLQKFADGYTYDVRAEGVARTVKPETKATRAAASTGNRIFERAASDEKFRTQMVKNGLIDLAEFEAWQAAKATTPATTETPAQA